MTQFNPDEELTICIEWWDTASLTHVFPATLIASYLWTKGRKENTTIWLTDKHGQAPINNGDNESEEHDGIVDASFCACVDDEVAGSNCISICRRSTSFTPNTCDWATTQALHQNIWLDHGTTLYQSMWLGYSTSFISKYVIGP